MEWINPKLANWASILEQKTREQAIMTSALNFVHPYMALMPDAHLGKGATVGSVIPTVGGVIPAAVGVDIGCGMIAVRTQFYWPHLEGKDLQKLHDSISSRIPLSAGHYNQAITETARKRISRLTDIAKRNYDNVTRVPWQYQLGSLGSGNHFIEVSLDERSAVWLFLHSGSRGIGNRLALQHINVAKELAERNNLNLADPDLAHLTEGTPQFTHYIEDMLWAQEFALLNREEMMDRVIEAFEKFIGESVAPLERINCHHNFTQKEEHFGEVLWLTRKGAIDAHEGTMGLIPGSMGTASYVVRGKGNKESFCSSPHGAGRNYSRNQAKKTFTLEQLRESMKGIVYRESEEFLDEISFAYKDIEQVMADAKPLVEIEAKLRQIVNVKGN